MKKFKQGASLVGVLIALVVASFGGGFSLSSSNSQISVESTYDVSSAKDGLVGTNGLHW
jgi:hypothetical protein